MINLDDICPDIESENPIERAMATCISSDSKDPVKILRKLMSDPDIPFHGPVHHSLVPFSMLTAYKNSGGDIDLEASMKAAHKRGSIIPAAVCGHWGACGSAMGCGIAFSVITGDGPLEGEIWSKGQSMVSDCLAAIAQFGGPRCCKRDGYLSIPVAVEFFNDYLGAEMETPRKIVCGVYKKNPTCLMEGCPFNPEYKE